MIPDCTMCFDVGWILDRNDMDKSDPGMLEFIECIIPDCEASGQPVSRISFKGPKFTEVSKHPTEGYVMAIGEFAGTP